MRKLMAKYLGRSIASLCNSIPLFKLLEDYLSIAQVLRLTADRSSRSCYRVSQLRESKPRGRTVTGIFQLRLQNILGFIILPLTFCTSLIVTLLTKYIYELLPLYRFIIFLIINLFYSLFDSNN